MSNVLIGVIGVILFIGLALAGALFLGPRFSNSKTDSEAARLMTAGSQISKAYELYRLQEGVYPDGDATKYASADASQRKLLQLKDKGYLKAIPDGGAEGSTVRPWYIDDNKGAALTLIGAGDGSLKICESARKQAGFTDGIKDCTATDIANNDPCCKA